ncbi:uncharacterized protein LOC120343280 [Styela clava]
MRFVLAWLRNIFAVFYYKIILLVNMADFVKTVGNVYHRDGDRKHELEMKKEEDGFRLSVQRIDNENELNKVKAGHDHEYKCLKEGHKHSEEMFDKKGDLALRFHKQQIQQYQELGCSPEAIMNTVSQNLPAIKFD